ncbi:hypothetical protein [Sanguibacter sp. 25GB23B1]|uniref:hypothetical protein n=1 Tax=unclassified Sanguibacter TaxID=2645534 RepID=UPI0032AF4590
MSTPEHGHPETPDLPVPEPVDDLAAVEASAQPARLRRAPRYRAFFWTGALLGIALGVALGLWVSDPDMINRWIYVIVIVFGTTLVTTLVAGLLAILADRRSAR